MTYYIPLDDENKPPISLNETDETRAVLQNIRMILETPKGSVPLYREFGLDMSFVDKPARAAKGMLIIAVKDAIERFEPRASFVGLSMESTQDGKLYSVVEVELNGA